MYLVLLQGQLESFWPGSSGAPTVWTQGTNSPSTPSTSYTALPMRVISFMFTATYGLSDSSTPMCAMGEPSGPIENGTTYIVRPFMQPSNSGCSVARISAGSIQLLVGPASSFFCEQMKVRSSTRATSLGSELARKEPGRLAGLSFLNVPASTSCWQRRSYSCWLPSHQWMRSGLHRAAISATHAISFAFLT